jgi:hypothetical protein
MLGQCKNKWQFLCSQCKNSPHSYLGPKKFDQGLPGVFLKNLTIPNTKILYYLVFFLVDKFKLQHTKYNILAGNKTTEAKNGNPNFTHREKFFPSNLVFINNDSNLTRALLLGK